jgi:hypothetical protein
MKKYFSLLLLASLFLSYTSTVRASGNAAISNDRASIRFPDTITFSANIQSDQTIQSVTLEYGTNQQTCGTVIARAFPQFTPGQNVRAEWVWEMRQSGSLPPGSTIWWQWRVIDQAGQETISPRQTIIWLDDIHNWQTIRGGNINLHWYDGDQDFGKELHTAAVSGLDRLEQDTGITTATPIDLYIYGGFDDMRDAILYEPSWTGGMAFSEFDIVIIGIAPENIEWGKLTEVHELTHVLVGHLTFSCLSDIPTWLSEGLAVYGEGGLDASSQAQLEQAIQADDLFPIRSLSGGFSEVRDKADLSYSQSYSIVNFLIQKYGQDRMTALLESLRDGNTIDDALIQAYGFDLFELETQWRSSIGAAEHERAPNPTATPQPTPVPTYAPPSGEFAQITPYPTPDIGAIPTPAPFDSSPAADFPLDDTSIFLTAFSVIAAACCCVVLLIIVVIVLIVRANNKRQVSHE